MQLRFYQAHALAWQNVRTICDTEAYLLDVAIKRGKREREDVGSLEAKSVMYKEMATRAGSYFMQAEEKAHTASLSRRDAKGGITLAVATAEPAKTNRRTILLVEGDRETGEVMQRILQVYGDTVILATGADEAIRRMETDKPNVVITEAKLTGGTEAGKAVLSAAGRQDIPTILLAEQQTLATTRMGASTETVYRPVRMDNVLGALNRVAPVERPVYASVAQEPAVLLGDHFGNEGTNDQIAQNVIANIAYFTHPEGRAPEGKLTRSEAKELVSIMRRRGGSRIRRNQRFKELIRKIATGTERTIDGSTFLVVEVPVGALAYLSVEVQGEGGEVIEKQVPVPAHLAVRDGIIWVASKAAPADIEMARAHEREEFNILIKYYEFSKHLLLYARNRPNQDRSYQDSFYAAHAQAWGKVRDIYARKAGEPNNASDQARYTQIAAKAGRYFEQASSATNVRYLTGERAKRGITIAAQTGVPASGEERRTILVVEDDPIIKKLMGDMLRQRGFNVVVTTEGADAIARMNPDEHDIVITDLGLDDGDTAGKTVLEAAEGQGIPVILFTGSEPQVLRAAGIAEATDVVHKPFSIAEIMAAIDRVAPSIESQIASDLQDMSETGYLARLKEAHRVRRVSPRKVPGGNKVIVPDIYFEDFANRMILESRADDVVVVPLGIAQDIAVGVASDAEMERLGLENPENAIVLLKPEDRKALETLHIDDGGKSLPILSRVLELNNYHFLHLAAAIEFSRSMLADDTESMNAFYELLMHRPLDAAERARLRVARGVISLTLPPIAENLIEDIESIRLEHAAFLVNA